MKTWQSMTLGILIGLLAAGLVLLLGTQARGTPILLEPPPTPFPIKVQVLGAVARPGVYDLPVGSRVQDALQASGGLTPIASMDASNPARVLTDGERIFIPSQDQFSIDGKAGNLTSQPIGDATAPVPDKKINLNTATQAELELLPAIGPSKAQSILTYRAEHGAFASVEQLLEVPGIGPSLFSQIKELVTIGETG